MNKRDTTVIGNLVDAPRLNATGNGSTVANFRIASTRRRLDQGSQKWVDVNTLYVDVECFGDLSGNVASSLVKGDSVIVSGDLYSNEWETEAGKRSVLRIRADAVGPDLTRAPVVIRRAPRNPGADVAPAERAATQHADLASRDTAYELDQDVDHGAGYHGEQLDADADDARSPQPALT